MGNLTNCLAKAGKAIDEADRRNLLARYDAHVKDGMPASDAGELAIREVHGGLMDSLNQLADSAAGAGVQMLVAEKIPDQATTGQQQPDAAENARLAALTPDAFAAEVMQLLGSSDAVYRAPRIPATAKSVKKAVRIGVPNATFIGINADPDQASSGGVDFTAGSNTPEALASARAGRDPIAEVYENVKYLGYSFTLPQPVDSKGDDPAPRFTIKVYQPSRNFPSGAVEVDVSGVGTGNNGALVYNAAAGFAAANGIPFRADSSGLKEFGAIRRTVTMANAAMRYGVQIVEPGERQLAPTKKMREAGIAPLGWENRGLGVSQRQAELNDERNRTNMANLLRAEAASVRQVIGPVVEQYGFDFNAGTFTKNGQPIDFGPQSLDVATLVQAGRSALSERGLVPDNPMARPDATLGERAAPPYGRASIARAVLVQSLAQTQGGAARRSVLDATRQLLSQQLGRGETDLTNLWSQSGGKPPGAFTSKDKAIVAMRAAWGMAFTRNFNNGDVVLVTQAEAIAAFEGTAGEAGAATAKGWFDPATGKVHIVWDMNTPDEIAGTFLHEFGVHKAAPEWLGSSLYNRLTRKLLADAQLPDADPRLKEAFAQAQAAQGVATDADAVRHETLAYLAELNPGDGMVVRLLDSFKGVLNALGFRLTRLESDTDLVLRVMRDALRSQARGNTGSTTARPYQGGEQFSQVDAGDEDAEAAPQDPVRFEATQADSERVSARIAEMEAPLFSQRADAKPQPQQPSRREMKGAEGAWRQEAKDRRATDPRNLKPGEWSLKFSQRRITPELKELMRKSGMPIDERPLLSRIRDGIRDEWQKAMASWHDGVDARIQALADRFRGVSAAEEAVEREIGRKLDANERSYVMMRMNLGLPSIMDAVLLYGAPRLEDQTWTQWADVEVNGVITEVVESAPSRGEAKAALEAKHPGAKVSLKSKPAQPVPGLPEKSGMTGGTHGVFWRNEQTEGLLDVLTPVADDLNGWLAWRIVQRAKLTMAAGKENLFTQEDIDAGDALADTPEKLAAFKKASEGFDKLRTAILDMAEQSGTISREGREAWDHAEYIPFFRQDADGKIKGPRNTKRPTDNRPGIRVLKGGEQVLADPLGNIVQNFAKLIDSSMKNIALERLVTTLSLNRDNADQIRSVLSGFPTVSQTQIQRAFARVGLYDRATGTFTQGDKEFSRSDLRQALRDAGIASDQINKAMGTQDADSIFFEKMNLEVTKALVPMSAVIKQMLDDGVPQAVIDNMPPSALKGLRELMAFAIPKGPDVFTVLRQGKVHSYRATDPLLLRSLVGMAARERGIVMRVLAAPARFLTGMVTRDPVFMVRNGTRAVLQDWIIAQVPYSPVTGAVAGAVRSMMGTGGAVDMMFAGASFHRGHVQVHDPDATATNFRRALRAKGITGAEAESAVLRFSNSILDFGRNGLAKWDQIGSAIENSTREAIYEAAIRAGLSRAEAAYMARDVMDFGLRGDSAVINALADTVVFFNARVQGMYKLYREGAIPGMGPKMRAAVIGRGMAVASFSVGLMALNLALFKEGYENLEEWEKDTYWHIMPGHALHQRIPKPFEIGLLFGTIPERLMMAIIGASTDYEEGDTLAKSARAAFSGVWNTLGMNPVPTALLPMVEVGVNINTFTGRDIENMGDKRVPKADVGEWYTSPIAKAAAGGMSDALQVAGFGPRAGLSAKQIEHLWRGYTGTIGGYALATADTIVNRLSGSPVTADDWTDWAMSVAPADIPFIPGRSTRPIADMVERGDLADGGTPRNYQQSKDFYQLYDDITVLAAGVKAKMEQAQAAYEAGDLDAEERLKEQAMTRYEASAGTLGEMEEARTKSGKLDARVNGGVRFTNATAIDKAMKELGESRDKIELIMTNPDLSRVEQRRQIEVIAAARKVTMQTMLDTIRASQRSAADKEDDDVDSD